MTAGPGEQPEARNRWEGFAREDAEYYILTELGDARTQERADGFFASGRDVVDRMLSEVGEFLSERGTAIELGCGIGRLLIPMAHRFQRVVGIDISPTMLARCRENCERRGLSNVALYEPDGPWSEPGSAQLVYSLLVFQHLEEMTEIADYLGRSRIALADDGVGYFQFDTRSATAPYRLRNALPDRLLRRDWRRGIRRIRRSRDILLRVFDRQGLVVLDELRPNTADHCFVVRRDSG